MLPNRPGCFDGAPTCPRERCSNTWRSSITNSTTAATTTQTTTMGVVPVVTVAQGTSKQVAVKVQTRRGCTILTVTVAAVGLGLEKGPVLLATAITVVRAHVVPAVAENEDNSISSIIIVATTVEALAETVICTTS